MNAEYIFVNPSPNMALVANYISSLGACVESVYLKDFVLPNTNSMWAFYGNSFIKLGSNLLPSDILSDICSMKKPFFKLFRYRYLKSRLENINPCLSGRAFQDYVLLNCSFWHMPVSKKGFKLILTTVDEVEADNPHSIIVSAAFSQGSEKVSRTQWRTDYNVEEALGNDYFFFFDQLGRYELYCRDNHIVCVGDEKRGLEWLKNINPTMRRFKFEKVVCETFYRNLNPWIEKVNSRIFLINDYSWYGTSATLPDNWAKIMGKFIYASTKKKV